MTNEGKIIEARNKYGPLLVFKPNKAINRTVQQINELSLERDMTNIVEKGGYDFFLDVGAGFGYYSRIASHYAKKVLSFEAHPIRHGFVKWNMMDLDNVEVYDWYIGTQTPHIRKQNPYGMIRQEYSTTKEYDVENHSLIDILHNGMIDGNEKGLIKIDVEGNELDVIRSAFPLEDFENCRWIIEIHLGIVKEQDVVSLFEGWNYKQLSIRKNNKHVMFWKG